MGHKLRKILSISFFKTARFNIHYFGLEGLFHPYVLIARNVILSKLGGGVLQVENKRIGTIQIGFPSARIVDSRYNRSIWRNDGIIVFKGSAFLASGTKIDNSGELIIGDDFHITANSMILCKKKIHIGKDVLISWNCQMMDHDFHKIINIDSIVNEAQPIWIGNHVWVGCDSIILKGTRIHNDSVIAAGSLITGKDCESNTIYGGINRRLKTGILWEK